jgi:hypothetical protein
MPAQDIDASSSASYLRALQGAGAVGTTLGAALLHSDQRFDVKYGERQASFLRIAWQPPPP